MTFSRENGSLGTSRQHSNSGESWEAVEIATMLDDAPTGPTQALDLGSVDVSLPAFIEPFRSGLDSLSIECLRKHRAFDFPTDTRRIELIRCYLKFLYPILPVVEPTVLVGTIREDPSDEKISLLLFWAILSSAMAYIDLPYLKDCVYSDRHSGRKITLQIINALLDSGYETDPMVIAQSLLLMNFWYDCRDETRDLWRHLGLALSSVRKMLATNAQGTADLHCTRFRLQKRVFWCCYVAHSLIAMAFRRSVPMDLAKFDVPPLEVADFEIDGLAENSVLLMGIFASKSPQVTIQGMGNAAIALVNLCINHSKISKTLRSGAPVIATSRERLESEPTRNEHLPSPAAIAKCEASLDQWNREHGFNILSDTDFRALPTQGEQYNLVEYVRTVLTALYLGISTDLYRPYVLNLKFPPQTPPHLLESYHQKLYNAADRMIDLHRYLQSRSLTRYQPNVCVSRLICTSVLHLYGAETGDTAARLGKVHNFECCMESLNQLRLIYSSAENAYRFLESIRQKFEKARRSESVGSEQNKRQFEDESTITALSWTQDDDVTAPWLAVPQAIPDAETWYYTVDQAHDPQLTFTDAEQLPELPPLDPASLEVDFNLDCFSNCGITSLGLNSTKSILPCSHNVYGQNLFQEDGLASAEFTFDSFGTTDYCLGLDKCLWEAC